MGTETKLIIITRLYVIDLLVTNKTGYTKTKKKLNAKIS